jgi:hypothetical protein
VLPCTPPPPLQVGFSGTLLYASSPLARGLLRNPGVARLVAEGQLVLLQWDLFSKHQQVVPDLVRWTWWVGPGCLLRAYEASYGLILATCSHPLLLADPGSPLPVITRCPAGLGAGPLFSIPPFFPAGCWGLPPLLALQVYYQVPDQIVVNNHALLAFRRHTRAVLLLADIDEFLVPAVSKATLGRTATRGFARCFSPCPCS